MKLTIDYDDLQNVLTKWARRAEIARGEDMDGEADAIDRCAKDMRELLLQCPVDGSGLVRYPITPDRLTCPMCAYEKQMEVA